MAISLKRLEYLFRAFMHHYAMPDIFLHTWEPVAEPKGAGNGGLVVYGAQRHCEQRVMIVRHTSGYDDTHVAYSSVSEHVTGSLGSFYAAYFPTLSPGRYAVYEPGGAQRTRQFVTVSAGSCAEVRFR